MTWTDDFQVLKSNLADVMAGLVRGPYEREVRRQTADLHDLFTLLCFMEAIGMPNPATLYLLEIYPYLLEQFHAWHTRMGMDHSPLGQLPCC